MNEYFVYGLEDFNGNVKYVGISNDPAKRFEQHKKDKSNPEKYKWVNLECAGFRILDTANSKREAEIKEEMHIRKYNSYDLFNIQKNTMTIEEAFVVAKKCIERVSKR